MSAFESSHINARVQKALFKRMLAVNRLVPNGVEEPGVGSANNLKQSLLTGQTFIPVYQVILLVGLVEKVKHYKQIVQFHIKNQSHPILKIIVEIQVLQVYQ